MFVEKWVWVMGSVHVLLQKKCISETNVSYLLIFDAAKWKWVGMDIFSRNCGHVEAQVKASVHGVTNEMHSRCA